MHSQAEKVNDMSDVVSRPALPIVGSILRAPEMLSVLRILTGLLFLEHGTGKLLGFPAGLPFIDQMPAGLLYFTGTMELIGGLLITIGLFTRPVAFILSGFMAVGYFWCTSHRASSRQELWRGGGAVLLRFSLPRSSRLRTLGGAERLTAALGGCQHADRLAPPAAPEQPGDDGEIERVP